MQVQPGSQELLAAMISEMQPAKIIPWKRIFVLHFIYFSSGIKMQNSDVSVDS